MLSKDHFSNILNEPAGKIASQVLKWVVPQIIACWDDERIDANRTLSRIVNGVFHHPALRDYGDDGAVDGRRLMFGVVQNWWGQKDERERAIMRDQLSRDGVEQGRNHKEGVQDTGHGCCKPLGMPTSKTASSSGAIGGPAAGAILGELGSALAGQSKYDTGYSGMPSTGTPTDGIGKFAEEAVGGGAIGGLLGGLVGGGSSLLGGVLGDDSNVQTQGYRKNQYEADGGYTQSYTETGSTQPPYRGGQQQYGQAQYSQTTYPGGAQREEYQRYEQDGRSGRTGFGEQVIREDRPTYGGGFEETTETRHERPGGAWDSEIHRQGRTPGGDVFEESNRYEGSDAYQQPRREESSRYNAQPEYNEEPRRYDNESRYGESRSRYETETVPERFDEPSYEERRRPQYEEGYEQERPAYGGGSERREEFGGREELGGREEFGGREEYGGREEFGGREETEREEVFEEGRGYGQGEDEYQERRW